MDAGSDCRQPRGRYSFQQTLDMRSLPIIVLLVMLLVAPQRLLFCAELTSTPLTQQGDLAAQMVEGIDRFLSRELKESITER